MQVTFYSGFRKRINSTKRPAGGTSKDVLMKDPCDMHSPLIKIQGTAGQYNYFQIGNTYYYVSGETVMPNNWIELAGEVDAMATCADDIKGTTAFIERSSAGTVSLVDSLAPSMTNGSEDVIASTRLPNVSSVGSYIVNIANFSAPILLEQGQFANLYNRLNSQDIIDQLKDSIVSLAQIVTGAIWIPFQGINTIGSANIKAGFVDTGVSGSIVGNTPLSFEVGLGTGGSTSSVDSSAYRNMKLHLPFVGAVPLSPDDFTGGTLNVGVAIDPQSGSMEYRVSRGTSVIGTFSGSCGVPIPVGTTSYNVGGATASIIGGVASMVSGNPIGALMAGANIFNGLSSYSSTGGGASSRAGLAFQDITLSGIKRTPPEPLTTKTSVVGLPTYKTMSLSAVSGYVKCVGASIESAQEPEVVERCNNYLNNGAWIE